MNINPLWLLCLLVRLSLIYIIYYFRENKYYKDKLATLLLFISLGFYYKGYYGSNNETQISKVFWHDSRYVHASFYSLSAYYLRIGKLDLSLLLLFMDILSSIFYRILINK